MTFTDKKKLLIASVCMLSVITNYTASAQNLGLSFSYFIPKHGYMSTPISPFSIRGLGKDINRFLAIETGASLYRMSGLAMKDLPLKNNTPFVGPNFTIFVPLELVVQLKGNGIQLDLKGGGFFFYGFDQKLDYGNIDRAIREKQNLSVANSTLTFKNKPGFGYHAGAELTIDVTSQVGVSIEANYLVGQSSLPLQGSYSGYRVNGTEIEVENKPIDYKDAKVDFTGLEFSIGLIFNSGGGQGPKAKKRRRRR